MVTPTLQHTFWLFVAHTHSQLRIVSEFRLTYMILGKVSYNVNGDRNASHYNDIDKVDRRGSVNGSRTVYIISVAASQWIESISEHDSSFGQKGFDLEDEGFEKWFWRQNI